MHGCFEATTSQICFICDEPSRSFAGISTTVLAQLPGRVCRVLEAVIDEVAALVHGISTRGVRVVICVQAAASLPEAAKVPLAPASRAAPTLPAAPVALPHAAPRDPVVPEHAPQELAAGLLNQMLGHSPAVDSEASYKLFKALSAGNLSQLQADLFSQLAGASSAAPAPALPAPVAPPVQAPPAADPQQLALMQQAGALAMFLQQQQQHHQAPGQHQYPGALR